MNKRDLYNLKRKVERIENTLNKMSAEASAIANYIQPYFDEGIDVGITASDGLVVVCGDNEIGDVLNIIKGLNQNKYGQPQQNNNNIK